jgi:hypothetical protein
MSPYTAVDEITSGPFVAVEVAGHAGRGGSAFTTMSRTAIRACYLPSGECPFGQTETVRGGRLIDLQAFTHLPMSVHRRSNVGRNVILIDPSERRRRQRGGGVPGGGRAAGPGDRAGAAAPLPARQVRLRQGGPTLILLATSQDAVQIKNRGFTMR